MARAKEKAGGRAVLCPVALDESWKRKIDATGQPGDPSRALWRTLTQKLIVDFSGWKSDDFDRAFQKLLTGLKVNYGPRQAPESRPRIHAVAAEAHPVVGTTTGRPGLLPSFACGAAT